MSQVEVEIHLGDNLEILKTFPGESFDLIYIDPPFNTGKRQGRTTLKTVRDPHGDRTGYQGQRYRTIQLGTVSYTDSFGQYQAFLEPRLREAYRVLKKTGAFFFHIDYREVHYCKVLLDQIFGRASFINEIIWAYDYGARSKRRWSPKHDNILWYAKTPSAYTYRYEAIDRVPYMAPGLVGKEKAERGKTPTDTWWNTIVPTNGKEKTGYPTQKPLTILNRIIRTHSHPGDRVLDFFAGSGTTGEAAFTNGRDVVLVDNNPEAIRVMKHRLARAKPTLYEEGKPISEPRERRDLFDVPERAPECHAYAEVRILAQEADTLSQEYAAKRRDWEGSPFGWIREGGSSRQKGTIGEKIVERYLAGKGFDVARSPNSEADRLINGIRAEIKMSTLWENGTYTFQQLRDQNYQFAVCLGISPFDAHCWVLPKQTIMRQRELGGITPQHGGAGGTDTAWLKVDPKNVPAWLNDCGGTLSQAVQRIAEIVKTST